MRMIMLNAYFILEIDKCVLEMGFVVLDSILNRLLGSNFNLYIIEVTAIKSDIPLFIILLSERLKLGFINVFQEEYIEICG